MSKSKESQEQIIEWFNHTYKQRGSWYLRPTKAYYIFLEILQAKPEQKLLDVACGLGRLLEASQDYGLEAFGVDISDVAVEKAKKKLPKLSIQWANAEHLPFEDNTFDLLTCLGSLERMIDRKKALQEMIRVCKPNAGFCFLVRNSNTTSWRLFKKQLGLKNKKGHQDALNYKQWEQLFQEVGLKIVDVYPDQYPIFKKQRLMNFGLKKINYRKLTTTKKPIEQANEFIFYLQKA